MVSSGKAHGLAMAIGKEGRVISSRGFGRSAPTAGEGGLWSGAAIDPERSIFEVASITKPFTCFAVLQLIEQGNMITLDTPIASILPGFGGQPEHGEPGVCSRDAVTIRHLMSHTSGLVDGVPVDRSQQPSLAEHVKATCSQMSLKFVSKEILDRRTLSLHVACGIARGDLC